MIDFEEELKLVKLIQIVNYRYKSMGNLDKTLEMQKNSTK